MLAKLACEFKFGEQFGGKIGSVGAIVRITRMGFLAGDEGGQQLLADGAQGSNTPLRSIALIGDGIEIDGQPDVETLGCGDSRQQRCRGTHAGGTVFFVGNGEEENAADTSIGFDCGQSSGKARLHVEKAAAGEVFAAFQISKGERVFACMLQPGDCGRQKPLRIKGERLKLSISGGRHDIEMTGEDNGLRACATLQRKNIAPACGIARN